MFGVERTSHFINNTSLKERQKITIASKEQFQKNSCKNFMHLSDFDHSGYLRIYEPYSETRFPIPISKTLPENCLLNVHNAIVVSSYHDVPAACQHHFQKIYLSPFLAAMLCQKRDTDL